MYLRAIYSKSGQGSFSHRPSACNSSFYESLFGWKIVRKEATEGFAGSLILVPSRVYKTSRRYMAEARR
jgi:hypothetical protein